MTAIDEPPEIFDPYEEPHHEPSAEELEELRQARFDGLVAERMQYHRANREALRRIQAEEAAAAKPEPPTPLDWTAFLTEEFPPPDWHVGKLVAQGQQVTLVGDGKAGKSLLALEMAWRTAAGLPFLGDAARKPRRVMYVDQENGWDDIQDRLRSFGATAEQLANLFYLSFPAYRPLSTEEGAADFLADVDRFDPDVVYLDTISRMVSGEENSSDPWLNLYRLVVQPLKASRRSSVRLDHFGKDKERGARGSSAKDQDIDTKWELRSVGGDATHLTLTRTHTRRGLGRDFYRIQRLGEQVADQWRPGATTHVLADEVDDGQGGTEWIGMKAVADQLDALKVPVEWGRDKVRTGFPQVKGSNSLLSEAINYRRNRGSAT